MLPANEAMHVPSPCVCTPLDKSWAHTFSAQSNWWNLSWKPTPAALDFHYIAMQLSPSYFPRFPVRPPCPRFRVAPSQRSSPQATSHGFPSVHPVHASVSLPPRQSKLNENLSIGDAFGKKNIIDQKKSTDLPPKNSPWFAQPLSSFFLPCWDRKMRI